MTYTSLKIHKDMAIKVFFLNPLPTSSDVLVTTPCLMIGSGGGSPANECSILFSPGEGRVAALNFLTRSGVRGRGSGDMMHSLAPPPRGVSFPACGRMGREEGGRRVKEE